MRVFFLCPHERADRIDCYLGFFMISPRIPILLEVSEGK